MREIGIDIQASVVPANTFLLYGDTRTGKTRFGATFPRPFIFVDVGERGYETIQTMDRDLWWEPTVAPIIVGIDQMSDFAAAVQQRLLPLIASGRVLSVVFDAFSFYCDFYLMQLMKTMDGADNRQIYGKLGTHLQFVRNTLHQLPVNVLWNCLAAAPESGDSGTTKMGGPLIPGSQGPKFAAGVNYLFYTRLVQKREKGEISEERYEIHTRQYAMYAAGNRLGDANSLPNPFVGGTYAELLPYLGYDPDDVRKAIKPIAQTNVAKPVAVATKPPIAKPNGAQPVAKPATQPVAKPATAPSPVRR